uniref:Glyco_18 domain-containing protein n=1 Tax=Caenorhabditis tropicalis TaxID=1561998 RepID=A0A1I7TUI3_9PELO
MVDENNRNPIYPIIPSEDTFPESRGSKRVIGYFLNYETQNIRREQLEKLTHAIFAFVPLNSDGTFEFQDERSQERLKSLRNKARRTGVKVLFSTDGRWMGEEFRQVVGDPVKQRTFINSILAFLNEYQLDGIELNWKWPKTPDQFKYSELLEKLRESFNNQYILCVAVPPAGIEDWVTGFDFDEIIEHCDFINVFSTDYNGPWDNQWGTPSGPMSPLYSGVGDRKNFNVDYTMQYYIQKTREPGKLNILIPFGIRLWRNVEEGEGPVRNVELVDGKAVGVICMSRGKAKEDGWQLTNPEWDEESKSSFFYEKGVYLTFETGKSVRAKLNYVDQMKLGGVCIWSVDMDDEEDSLLNFCF